VGVLYSYVYDTTVLAKVCVCGRGVERSSEKLALAGFEEERSGVEDCPWSQAARIRINGFLILIFTA
jgi:hypothetical protein